MIYAPLPPRPNPLGFLTQGHLTQACPFSWAPGAMTGGVYPYYL